MATSSGTHAAGTRRGKRRLCGVPSHECCGSAGKLSPGLTSGLKSHATPEDAFQCHRAWLLRQGYRQVGGREFEAPDTGRVVVLTKRRRFGAVLRGGKEGRFMPGHFLGGCVIS
jgi:hypothetical protein